MNGVDCIKEVYLVQKCKRCRIKGETKTPSGSIYTEEWQTRTRHVTFHIPGSVLVDGLGRISCDTKRPEGPPTYESLVMSFVKQLNAKRDTICRMAVAKTGEVKGKTVPLGSNFGADYANPTTAL